MISRSLHRAALTCTGAQCPQEGASVQFSTVHLSDKSAPLSLLDQSHEGGAQSPGLVSGKTHLVLHPRAASAMNERPSELR